jgi:NAD(P)-dependent dehydrogenase (short-subunit alcohol dehydrogenase family)
MELKDKIAFVTGVSGGIGRAIAQRLAEEATKVVIRCGRLGTLAIWTGSFRMRTFLERTKEDGLAGEDLRHLV